MNSRWLGIVGSGFLVAAAPAADLDVGIRRGDAVRGTLLPATESETFRIDCPEGARLTVTLAARSGLRRAAAAILDPDGVELAAGVGGRVRLGAPVSASGTHRVEVTSPDGVTTGDYALRVQWKGRRAFAATVPVEGPGVGSLRFGAGAGARVDFSVAPARGSAALPSLVRVVADGGGAVPLAPGRTAAFVAPATGGYTLEFENTGSAGDVAARVRVRTPAAGMRRLFATVREIPAGTDVRAAAVLDAGGGVLAAPATGPLAGARVAVPPGALGSPVLLVLGVLPDLAPPDPPRSTRATAAAFLGPLGLAFGGAVRPAVEIPLAPAAPVPGSLIRVFAGLGPAPVVGIPGAALDGATSRVTFTAAACTRFQGWFVEPAPAPPPVVLDLPADSYATSVAVGGGFAFVGCPVSPGPAGEPSAGLVRVYERVGPTWIERAPLRAPAPAAGDTFGFALAYRRSPLGPADDSLLVGLSRRDLPGAADAGGIQEFSRTAGGWTFRTEIPHPGPLPYGMFGETMAVEGDRLVASSGGLRIYDRTPTGWTLADTVTTTGAWTEAYYSGCPVALDADGLAVGVVSDYARYGSGHQSGSVYVYAPSEGSYAPAGSVADPDPASRTVGYGSAVALGPGTLAVFAAHLDPEIRLFRRGDLAPEGAIARPIQPGQGSRSPELTGAMAFRGGRLFVGARTASGGPAFAGAYTFRQVDGTWNLEGALDASAYLGAGPNETALSGGFAVDMESLVLPVNLYDNDTALFRTRLAFFDLRTE